VDAAVAVALRSRGGAGGGEHRRRRIYVASPGGWADDFLDYREVARQGGADMYIKRMESWMKGLR